MSSIHERTILPKSPGRQLPLKGEGLRRIGDAGFAPVGSPPRCRSARGPRECWPPVCCGNPFSLR
jgi:hypothetical protein